MNILLIYPDFLDTFWSFKFALKFIHKQATSPPIGLLTVAALLPNEWSKRLVDMTFAELTDQDIAWADYAFVSAMLVQRGSAEQLIARCNAAGVKVVAGGPLFSSEPESFPTVDYLVLNEAEITLPLFLKDLEQGTLHRIYTTSEFADITQTPIPLWELADIQRYATLAIQYSRGCPYDCDFCNVTVLFGTRPRVKTSGQIIQELDLIYKMGWRGAVLFVDDNMIGNRKLLKNDLLPALIEWRKGKRGITFNTSASINITDDEPLMNMMVNAGFDMLFIGIETPNEESLAEANKMNNTNRDLVADVKRIQRHGLQVEGGFIIGFDSDPPSIFQRQIDLIQKSGIVSAMVAILQAPIGTQLYERMRKENRLLGHSTGNSVDGTTNILTKMDSEVLNRGYKSLVEYLYTPKNYYARVHTLLIELRPPKFTVRFDLTYVMAFFHTIYSLGIVGKERTHYWKLLFWTLFRRPKVFPLAITLAVYGYHFRQVLK
ncbi:MAG: B12-binding domain-containing radical SAM protein [Anaerolineaceae bacterium]|jgi:radical SAM superfamily enzyme YgiQ (UPF0313 family)